MAAVWEELKRRNVVRVAIAYAVVSWLILQLTDVLMPMLGLPEWVDRLVFFLLVIGFLLALIFAWAYELTPGGVKKETDVDRSESITQMTGRRLDFAIIGVLAIALVFFASTHQWSGETDNAEIVNKSIAVLPFVNMSSDPEQEYFSDGISEELLNLLSKISGLQVSARTSSFQFKGENLDIIDIGQQLNAGLILEGSVRKSGPKVRITAQLVDARNGFHLWSDTYDKNLEDIFAVQDEISAAIVGALQAHLNLEVTAAPRADATTSPKAHEAYLRGEYLLAQGTRTGREGGIREFEKALFHDPSYAPAHAKLAIAILGPQAGPRGEGLGSAAHHIEQAMALNSNLAESHAAKGLLLWAQFEYENALASFRHAVQINPNYVIVYVWMGQLLNAELGRYEEAFEVRKMGMRLDPLSIPTIVFYQQALIERNRLDEAGQELEKIAAIHSHVYAYRHGTRTSRGGKMSNAVLGSLDALKINPQFSQVRAGLAFHFAVAGLEKEALAIVSRPQPDVVSYLGKPEDAVTTAESRLAENPDSLSARHDLGLALAGAGDYDRARPILEEMWQRRGRISKRGEMFRTDSAAALIAIRREAGDEADIDVLVAAMRDNVRRYRKAGIVGDGRTFGVDYEEGLAAYLSGDRDTGLALLDKATEDGVFIKPREAYLQSLYDDPGFAPIRARQEARQLRERERVLRIVCSDNPYVAVWQPAEGTCERFLGMGGSN